MDNAGRPNETDMIDGEPYSVDDLRYLAANDILMKLAGIKKSDLK